MKQRVLLGAVLVLPVWLLAQLHCSSAAASEPGPAAPKAASAGPPGVTSAPSAPAVSEVPADLFASTVRPILLGHCAPCHEPGGVMYERLPFDHSDVVAAHAEGVLKRIKAPDERAAIERWLAAQPKG